MSEYLAARKSMKEELQDKGMCGALIHACSGSRCAEKIPCKTHMARWHKCAMDGCKKLMSADSPNFCPEHKNE